jgi:hypothetical protein
MRLHKPTALHRCIQESEFSTGLHAIANFGDEPYTLADGRIILPRSTLVEE